MPPSGRPLPGEYAAYAQADIDLVEGDDIATTLIEQREVVLSLLAGADEDDANFVYAPGKWSLKQVIGHLCDDERIFAYRALCIARGDTRPLPGFDENEYMAEAGFEWRTLDDLLAEYRTVRWATFTLFTSMTRQAWLRRGIVNGYEATPRGLAFHIAGHELHHVRVLREKYLR